MPGARFMRPARILSWAMIWTLAVLLIVLQDRHCQKYCINKDLYGKYFMTEGPPKDGYWSVKVEDPCSSTIIYVMGYSGTSNTSDHQHQCCWKTTERVLDRRHIQILWSYIFFDKSFAFMFLVTKKLTRTSMFKIPDVRSNTQYMFPSWNRKDSRYESRV